MEAANTFKTDASVVEEYCISEFISQILQRKNKAGLSNFHRN